MNYQVELEKEISKNSDRIPTLLLHSCCAPCSSYVLEYLSKYFKITIYYYNPNMDTIDEYTKRLNEQVRLINEMPNVNRIDLIKGDYDNKKYLEYIKGLELSIEGGDRCHKCYRLRLEETAKLAKMLNYDYFCTTLTVSPYKNASIINSIGKDLEREYNINYLYSDFKKKEGYKRSITLSHEYNLYRQDYCGCVFSRRSEHND